MASNESNEVDDSDFLEDDNDSRLDFEASLSLSCSGSVLLWYKLGIFALFTFEKEFTEVIPPYDKNIRGKCVACQNSESKTITYIKGRRGANTNFHRHYELVHPNKYTLFLEKLKKEKEEKKAQKRKRIATPSKIRYTESEKAESKARAKEFFVRTPLSKPEQDKINQSVLDYVIANALPLSTVDSYYFKKMAQAHNPRTSPISSKILGRLIDKEYQKFQKSLKAKFSEVSVVCLTADIWSSRRRSFLGVTAHWLDEVTLKRSSAAIGCKRFIGSHTYDKISTLVHSIIVDFGLAGKLQNIVTDNGSNFIKAMRIYFASPSMASASESNGTSESCQESQDRQDIKENETDEAILELLGEEKEVIDTVTVNRKVVEIDTYEVLDTINHEIHDDGDDERNVWLPSHIRCAAHTLNLLATTDFQAVMKSNPSFNSFYTRAYKRVKKLWKKSNKSTNTADIVKKVLDRYLPTPCATRWNSTFDSLVVVLNTDYKLLVTLCERLAIPLITEEDIEYLFEYVRLMEPISVYLDLLQGEDNCYLGLVLPSITKIKGQLEALVLDKASLVRDGLLEKLDKRFGALFVKDDYILASVSHPKFKFAWMSSQDDKEHARSRLNSRLNSFGKRVQLSSSSVSTVTSKISDPFCFNEESSPTKDEIDLYLSDKDSSLSMLERHPTIKSVFLKYNTAVPSSAPVERLFSIASLVLTARRTRLKDKLLEYLILLKISKNL